MSFEIHMKPYLRQSNPEDAEWYVKATQLALNNYMSELEVLLQKPGINVMGTITTPVGAPVPFMGPVGYFIPNRMRFTYEEVKTAMWCGNPELTFKNLFNLFGNKFKLNFTQIQALPALSVNGVCVINQVFDVYADNLIANVRAYGTELNCDTFLTIESNMLKMSLTTIPPITVPLIGAALMPTGAWVGNAIVTFGSLII